MIGHSLPTLEKKPYSPIMPKYRIIPTFALLGVATLVTRWAGAQAPPAAPPAAPAADAATEAPTEAEKLIDEAVKKVAALKSVSAVVQEKVEMLGQKFSVGGNYLKGPAYRLRMDLTVKGLPDSAGKMSQVCDGQTLWDYRQVLEARLYFKVGKIPQIMEKLNSPELDARLREQAVAQLGLVGPEVLLTGLRKTIKFDQKEEGTLDGKAVWVLHGTWKNREGILGPNQQPIPPLMPLPAYIPSVASLWIDKETGWPHKMFLEGKAPTILEDTRPRGPDGKPFGRKIPAQKVEASKVELVYADVKLNPELKSEEFAFEPPPDARVEDNTEALLNGLDQAIQAEAAKKKAEAEKKSEADGPLLNKGLDLPKTEPAK
ncbi:MAG: hypothetical protein P4L84_11935 [Isosphaeraceae bacterium]|nr:hypothetical protein [Isosphaeraceae bacterium]